MLERKKKRVGNIKLKVLEFSGFQPFLVTLHPKKIGSTFKTRIMISPKSCFCITLTELEVLFSFYFSKTNVKVARDKFGSRPVEKHCSKIDRVSKASHNIFYELNPGP